jgi:hypothetical protein
VQNRGDLSDFVRITQVGFDKQFQLIHEEDPPKFFSCIKLFLLAPKEHKDIARRQNRNSLPNKLLLNRHKIRTVKVQ